MTDRLKELSRAGVSIWLDDLSRDRLESGNLAELTRTHSVVGVTSNPSIFAKALSDGEAYTEQLRGLKAAGETDPEDVITTLTTDDIRNACDLFRPIYDATSGFDGRVSLEVDPRLAHDLDATVAQARALHALVDRENLHIKIPATDAGLQAITATIAAGISVNVTLIFSVQRYEQVLDAYLSGLEQAQRDGVDLSKIHSVASIFVSRNDVEVDKRLEAIGSDEALALRGRVGLAISWLSHEAYAKVTASDRWQALASAGANVQRPLWASTGTKNKEYSDVLYVEELITQGVVNTMPEKTLEAFADHGEVRGDTVVGRYDEGRRVIEALRAVGVDLDDVNATVEAEGVTKFIDPWVELIDTVQHQLDAV